MRAYLATTVAAACACTAALVLPIAFPAAAPAASRHGSVSDTSRVSDAQGATHVLALVPLTGGAPRARNAPVPEGVTSRTVKPFSLLGITWKDAAADLDGTVEVRTRSRATGHWSGWQDLENSDDVPDLDSPERAGGRTRGGTAPLWVGDADGVQVRVTPQAGSGGRAGHTAALPAGLRVDLVDPGAPAAERRSAAATRTDHPGTWAEDGRADTADDTLAATTARRPGIVTRAGWGADEGLRERAFGYTGPVRAVFVHHTATGNRYSCGQVPAIIRGIYRYHVRSEGWRDIGYNFLIDKCGRIYEGRAGGVTRPVLGAHTLGFNTDTTGIAVIGTFTRTKPSTAAVHALERLAAWKLSLSGVNADARTTLISRGSDKYRSGARVRFATISGHRDGFPTACPGTKLYDQLPAIRRAAARLQGR